MAPVRRREVGGGVRARPGCEACRRTRAGTAAPASGSTGCELASAGSAAPPLLRPRRRLGLESPAIATGPEPTEDQAGSGSTVIGLAHCPIMTILPRSNQALGSFHPPETRELLKSRFRVRSVGFTFHVKRQGPAHVPRGTSPSPGAPRGRRQRFGGPATGGAPALVRAPQPGSGLRPGKTDALGSEERSLGRDADPAGESVRAGPLLGQDLVGGSAG